MSIRDITKYPLMEHPPIKEEWEVHFTRDTTPTAFILNSAQEQITSLKLDMDDQLLQFEILEHLVECHNLRVRGLRRKRK